MPSWMHPYLLQRLGTEASPPLVSVQSEGLVWLENSRWRGFTHHHF
jgi:hypothetical protein